MSKKKHKKNKAERAGKASSEGHGGKVDVGSLPTMLREAGAALLAKADTPAGREAIASGLALAAAAASAAALRSRQEAHAAAAEPRADGGTAGAEQDDAAKPGFQTPPVVEALSAAAGAFMSRLMERKV